MRIRNLKIAALASMAVVTPFASAEAPTVRTEVKIFSLRDKSFREMHLSGTFLTAKVVPMDEKAKANFMESLTARKDCTLLSAPAMTTESGRTCRAEMGHKETFLTRLTIENRDGNAVCVPGNEDIELGIKLAATPKVSADGRYVQMHLEFSRKDLESEEVPLFPITTTVTPVFEGGSQGVPIPFTQFIQQPKVRTIATETTINLPQGGSTLLYLGSQKMRVKSSTVLPLFNELPYLNRLFRAESSTPDTEHFCMIVTAKIVAETPEKVGMTLPSPHYLQHPPQYIPADPVLPLAREVLPASYAPPIAVAPPVIAAEVTPAGCVLPKPMQKHHAILKILMEQYEAACKAGDTVKAKVIAAHCLELDPACFSRK